MRRISFLAALILFATSTIAQQTFPTKDQLEKFFKSDTYFVLDNNQLGVWNTTIESAVKKHWTITTPSYISEKDLNNEIKNPEKAFLSETLTFFDGKKNLGVFKTISIVMGKQNTAMVDLPAISDFIIAHNDRDYDEYYYKIGLALEFTQKHLKWLRANPDLTRNDVLKYYRENQKSTKTKMLYLIEEELDGDVNTVAEIKKIYSGKVELVSQDDVQDAIENKTKDVVILHKVSPPNDIEGKLCLKILIGVDDLNVYYFDYHRIKLQKKAGKFLASDFKKLEKK